MIQSILEKLMVTSFYNVGIVETGVLATQTSHDIKKVIRESLIKEIEGLKKDRFLKKDRLAEQLAWIEGHKKALSEAIQIIEGRLR